MRGRPPFAGCCLVLALGLFGPGCRERPAAPLPAQARPAPPPAPPAPAHDAAPADGTAAALPPVDCPLRKLGIEPPHGKPFESAQKYIAFLERPDRAVWQKPDAVVAALGLTGGETVFDVGAGSGYFSFRFAKALPHGKVVAGDTEPEMIRHIHHKAMTEGVGNLEVALLAPDAPSVPAGTDLLFVCDVLHHVGNQRAWLGRLAGEMKPGARLAIVEFKKGKLPQGPPEHRKLGRAQIVALTRAVGLKLVAESSRLLPYQTLMIFRKPEDGSKP